MTHRADKFEIECTGFLNAKGEPMVDLPAFAGDRETLVAMYSAMVRTRTFDTKAIALQRTGRLGTYASSLGQEAIGVGVASAMTDDDVFLPSFREHAAQLWRGISLKELFLYWGGDERGNDFAESRQDFPVCIPVASQFPHAAGVALAIAQKQEPGVAVAVAGDGATSKGDFYEAMNVIGAWNLPAVFVINNNQWAISVRRTDQTAAKTIAQKAFAAGLAGEQVDGNDVIAVRHVLERALAKARAGGGATLVECLSYRLGRQPVPRGRRGSRPLEGSACRTPAQVSRCRPRLEQTGRGRPFARADERGRTGCGRLSGKRTRTGKRHGRQPVRNRA
jgi:pyruvate dehydrogenase E1 component alpha subunit